MTVVSHAQWQPDVRLTNNSAVSWTSYNNAWNIAASGSVLHALWYDNRDGNYEIYYKRSTDAGMSWGADTRLTNNSALSELPSVAVSGQVVHVAWEEQRDGNREIYYKRSTDGGTSWGADIRLTNNSAGSIRPSVSASGSTVHVVWDDDRDGNREIYYKRSTDAGVSWGADVRLTNNSAESGATPSVSVSGSTVHVAWDDARDGNWEIYYKRSTNGGVSWGADVRLTNDSGESGWASGAVSDSVVHVVWQDDRDGNYEIYYKRSTDGGTSWEPDTRLTSNSAASEFPSVSVSGSTVHVVWHDNRDGNREIYYKTSTDAGITWEADKRLTNNSGSSDYASVSVSGQFEHVVWQDYRDGNYEIYYKRDSCGLTATITPNGPTTFCAGGSVMLTSSGASSYAWSTGATTQAITVTTSGSYNVTVTYANGCMGSASPVAVTVNVNPAPTITPNGPTTFCAGGSVMLTSSSASSYFWSNGATTQAITVTTSGTFNVMVTNSNGCLGSATAVTVTVNANPTPAITPNGPTTFCLGGSVMLTSSSASSYTWSTGASTQAITVMTSGTYDVTVTNGNGCIGISSPLVVIAANPIPIITPDGPTTFCQGGSIMLATSAATTYLWSNASTTQSITVTTSGAYNVTVTDSIGCAGSGTPVLVTVHANPSPTITPGGPTTFCDGGSVVLTSSIANAYAWSNGATTQAVTVGAGGAYDVTVTDVNGCTGTAASVSITVNPNPTPAITPNGPTTFCLGDSVTLTSSAASSYAWSNGATTQSVTVTLPGSYNVTVSDGNGCVGSATPVTVTINPNPTPTVTPNGPTTFCVGGSVILTSSPASSYTWSNGATTQAITPATSGSYSVTVTDAIGCLGSSTPVTVTVYPNPSPTITPGGPTTFCDGGSVTLMASAATSYLWSNASTTQSILVTTSGSYIVTVTDANGCVGSSTAMAVQVNANPTPTATPNGPTVFCDGGFALLTSSAATNYLWSDGSTTSTITVMTSGSYNVTVTDSNGCQGSATPVTVTVNPNPTPTITPGGPTIFCDGDSAMLSASASTSYLWSNGATAQTITATTSGSYNVTVTDANGCEGSATPVSVTVHANPQVPLIQQEGLLLICSVGGMSGYEWYHNSNLLATCNTDTCQCVAAGDYQVVITDVNDCSSSSGTFTTANCPLGVAVPGLGPAIHLYPNPSSGKFVIELSRITARNVSINLTNTLGETVFLTDVTGSHTVLVDLGDVPSGFYVVHVEADGEQFIEKVIVE